MIKRILCIGFLFIVGCRDIRQEYGPVVSVKGVVESSTYTAARGYVFQQSQPEEYIVVIKWPIGKFRIESKRLWEILSAGENIIIQYQEVFTIEYKNNQEINRISRGKVFVSAYKND